MRNTILFGNGLNRISNNSVSWDHLLETIKGVNSFKNKSLPNTMVYERIFMERHSKKSNHNDDEMAIKNSIACVMKSQETNEIYSYLAEMDVSNYLTTNYDYAFEKALELIINPLRLSTEDIYSLRRKRKYETDFGDKFLWNIHGEIDHPKSIMLGLDHYCGSVSKIDSYIKGNYKHISEGEVVTVEPMKSKIKDNIYCTTSWVDLFFSTNVHILGLSLDYSETDIWWLLNKRARFAVDGLINNKIYFHVNKIDEEMAGLLKSFYVDVVVTELDNKKYKQMYKSMLNKV
jgi:hypothetical protein